MENEDIKVSIIVPVYNVEKYIRRCIESLINQTFKKIEIILIDDGSTDKSGNICDEYEFKDNRIKVIHTENGGQSKARNKGLSIAKGEYIGFVDSDDYIAENMFEILYEKLCEYEADISICNIIETCKSIHRCIENYDNIEIYNNRDSIEELIKNHITNYVYNKLYKRKLWDSIFFPVGKVMEDMDVMYKVIERAHKVVCTNKSEYYYCIREDSSISKIDTKVTDDLRDVVNRRYEYLINKRSDLVELLKVEKLYNIFQYHYNLSYCGEHKIYNNEEFSQEYKFYKENFIKVKKELLKNKKIRKKLEFNLLYINRTLYYYYNRLLTSLKHVLKKRMLISKG